MLDLKLRLVRSRCFLRIVSLIGAQRIKTPYTAMNQAYRAGQ
jgi:hypothetical protein